jgi:hypothetical protein
MDLRKRVAATTLFLMPLAANGQSLIAALEERPAPPPVARLAADHSIAFSYITQGSSTGWLWSSAFTITVTIACTAAFAAPPAAIACAASAAV